MHITSYLGGGFEETVMRFRDALETRVKALFLELLRA